MSRRCGDWLGGDEQLVNNNSPVYQLGGLRLKLHFSNASTREDRHTKNLERPRKGTRSISKPGLAIYFVGPSENENVRPLAQKLLRIPKQRQQRMKPKTRALLSMGPCVTVQVTCP